MVYIIIAFSNPDDGNRIKGLLVRNGFCVSGVCTSGAQAIQQADALAQSVLVCGAKLHDLTCAQIHENLSPKTQMLVVASKRMWDAFAGQEMMFIEMPLRANELLNTLSMMVAAQERRRKKERQKPRVRSQNEKDVILEAKLLLMEKNNLTEAEAYRYIQKSSMDSGNTMVETAQMLLSIMG